MPAASATRPSPSTPFDVTHTERTATVTRWMIDIEPPPFWAKQLGRPGEHVDRWQIIYFQAPSVGGRATWASRVTGTGAPQGDRSQGVNGAFLAAITPETDKTCHYFWNFVRTFRTDDEQLTRDINKAHVNEGKGVYDQDHTVLEAQQMAIDRNPRMPFYNLNIDAGALWARRDDRRDAGRGARSTAARPEPGGRVACDAWPSNHRMAQLRSCSGPRDLTPRHPALRDRACGRLRDSERPAATSM